MIRRGARHDLPAVLGRLGATRALLVTDRGLRATPWVDDVAARMRGAGVDVRVDDGVAPNPRADTVDALAAVVREAAIDVVVGLGGGSALDAGKAVAMLAPQGASGVRAFEGRDRFAAAPLPFVALPTTCGTGSEVTWVSVLTVPEARRKISVKGARMFPADALVDPELLVTLPRALVVSTGLDALTHAVEARIGRASNPVSDVLAERAAAQLLRWLPVAARRPGDLEALEALATAACVAGIAFGNADVAGVHCLSESLGGRFDVPHGLANAMLLAPTLRVQFDAAAPGLGALADAARLSGAAAFVDAVEALVRDLDVPPLSSLGLSPDDLAAVADDATRNGSHGSNPRPMSVEDYLEVLAVAG